MDETSFPQVQDYGIIGDCRAAVLISREGSVEWRCWPRFDKPAIFAALLDREKGGCWRIAPAEPAKDMDFALRFLYLSRTRCLELY